MTNVPATDAFVVEARIRLVDGTFVELTVRSREAFTHFLDWSRQAAWSRPTPGIVQADGTERPAAYPSERMALFLRDRFTFTQTEAIHQWAGRPIRALFEGQGNQEYFKIRDEELPQFLKLWCERHQLRLIRGRKGRDVTFALEPKEPEEGTSDHGATP